MARTSAWPWWRPNGGPDDYQTRELLRAVLDLHGYFGDQATWLWRGQANSAYKLSPGAHTRVERSGLPLTDDDVKRTTENLLRSTRASRLDVHEGAALPDFALLAQLQHHGAATPLLDVSLDPLVALYMAVVSPDSHDDQDGALFAIKMPEPTATSVIEPFDTRSFQDIYDAIPHDRTVFYRAPDVSDRLRIQRGYFLVSRVDDQHPQVTIHLSIDDSKQGTWIGRRMDARGAKGRQPVATSDVAVFRVPAKFKPRLQRWLEERTGLSRDFVYPTVWHQPHHEAFAKSDGRKSSAI